MSHHILEQLKGLIVNAEGQAEDDRTSSIDTCSSSTSPFKKPLHHNKSSQFIPPPQPTFQQNPPQPQFQQNLPQPQFQQIPSWPYICQQVNQIPPPQPNMHFPIQPSQTAHYSQQLNITNNTFMAIRERLELSIRDLDNLPWTDDCCEALRAQLSATLKSMNVFNESCKNFSNEQDYSTDYSESTYPTTISRHSQTPDAVLTENDFKSKQENDIETLLKQTRDLLEDQSIRRGNVSRRGRGRR